MKEASASVRQVQPSCRLSLFLLQLDVNHFQHFFLIIRSFGANSKVTFTAFSPFSPKI